MFGGYARPKVSKDSVLRVATQYNEPDSIETPEGYYEFYEKVFSLYNGKIAFYNTDEIVLMKDIEDLYRAGRINVYDKDFHYYCDIRKNEYEPPYTEADYEAMCPQDQAVARVETDAKFSKWKTAVEGGFLERIMKADPVFLDDLYESIDTEKLSVIEGFVVRRLQDNSMIEMFEDKEIRALVLLYLSGYKDKYLLLFKYAIAIRTEHNQIQDLIKRPVGRMVPRIPHVTTELEESVAIDDHYKFVYNTLVDAEFNCIYCTV